MEAENRNDKTFTLIGFSVGDNSLSLFLQRSISVNFPDLPMAWANANTTS